VTPRLQTLDFDSPAGPWRLSLWTPAPDLCEYVSSLWATESQTVSFCERIVPRESIELMINFGGPQHLRIHGSTPSKQVFRRAWVSGLQTSCLEIESPTAAQLIAASLRPTHAGALLGVSGRELSGRVVALDEVLAHEADRLASRLEESPSEVGRFLLFEDFLRSRLRQRRRLSNPAVSRVAAQLAACGGQTPIRELTRELGCSPRYLESRMLDETGLSPKRLARLIRFSRAIESIRAHGPVDWGRVAHSCGYYDQPHFNRDFKMFCGVTPTEFLAAREASSQAMIVE
jgi:AraC-like DNA-binding protein